MGGSRHRLGIIRVAAPRIMFPRAQQIRSAADSSETIYRILRPRPEGSLRRRVSPTYSWWS